MSLTEDIPHIEDVNPPPVTPAETTARVLLVWDAPNLDMGLGSILGGRPTARTGPGSTPLADGCCHARPSCLQSLGVLPVP